jgi:hypothetical protein
VKWDVSENAVSTLTGRSSVATIQECKTSCPPAARFTSLGLSGGDLVSLKSVARASAALGPEKAESLPE